ncbi:hypothetical protein P3C38_28280 [Mesorhizobium sp. DSM 30133]|nr:MULTISPECIES: hypothetical protein [Mesorhizobium]MDF3233626.1 hypothetical protein [Mesorhizobium sp. DSM 30133]
MMKAVWNGLAVTDDSLVQCIHEIRAALTTVARPSCRQCRGAVTGWSFPQMPDKNDYNSGGRIGRRGPAGRPG